MQGPMSKRERQAFAKGWYEGALGIALHTSRGVATLYPELSGAEIDCYLNGAEDGRAGDRWRLDYEESKGAL